LRIQFQSEYEDDSLFYNHCIKTDQTQQDYRTHYHDLYEILFLKEGNISYLTESGIHHIRRNNLILTRPKEQHCIRIDGNVPYDRYDLVFTPDAASLALLQKLPVDLHVISFDANPMVIHLFEKMDFYCQKLSGASLGKILLTLTEEVLLQTLLYVQDAKKDGRLRKQPLTLQAITYIDDNLLTLPDVTTICRNLGISRSYLYQLFQEDMDTTPKRYIMERRLNLARQELFLGAKPTEIYTQCGFSDYSAFFRAYKKHFGYPPTGTHHANFVRSSSEDSLKSYWE
jgi:AraC-like DNA-binding protein